MTRRRFLASGAVAVSAAGLALAGCGVQPASSGSADQDVSSGLSSSDEATSSSSEPASAASEQRILTGACAYASTDLNPLGPNGASPLVMSATRHVLEGLYDLDMHTYTPYPALAAAMPLMISDVEYEITLREGARFSNGSAVTADDVVNAFAKSMANATFGALLDFIDQVGAKDASTIAITLKHPMEGLLENRLALVKVFPAAQESRLSTLPIGSGPWAYVEGSVDGSDGGAVSFVPNPHYNGPMPAQADEMTWSIMKADGRARTTAVRDRVVQVAESLPDDRVGQLLDTGVEAQYVQGFNQAFLMFNTLKPPFDDKRVRQAFFYAIDVEELISSQFKGHAVPVSGFLPKGHPHYHAASTAYSLNPTRAKILLAEAGVKDLAFTLLVNNNWVADLAPLVKDDLEAVGLECTVREEAIQWADFAPSERILDYDVVLAAGDPTCYGNDPDLLLGWWYGDNAWTRGRSCWAKDPNGSFDIVQELLAAARESSGDERQELWNECFDIIADEVPLYALFHRQIATGFDASRIAGFKPLSTAGLDFLGCAPKR